MRLLQAMRFRFFPGFCLKDEKEIFNNYLIENDFTISGFSYGAIKAFEYILNSKKRFDLLQLFSPAFFQYQDEKFKRVQLMFFKKDKELYCRNFLRNVSYNSNVNMHKYSKQGTFKELYELLNYIWIEEKLENLVHRGVKIEVYLGSEDKIIDSNLALEFFKQYSTVYFMKGKGHIL